MAECRLHMDPYVKFGCSTPLCREAPVDIYTGPYSDSGFFLRSFVCKIIFHSDEMGRCARQRCRNTRGRIDFYWGKRDVSCNTAVSASGPGCTASRHSCCTSFLLFLLHFYHHIYTPPPHSTVLWYAHSSQTPPHRHPHSPTYRAPHAHNGCRTSLGNLFLIDCPRCFDPHEHPFVYYPGPTYQSIVFRSCVQYRISASNKIFFLPETLPKYVSFYLRNNSLKIFNIIMKNNRERCNNMLTNNSKYKC